MVSAVTEIAAMVGVIAVVAGKVATAMVPAPSRRLHQKRHAVKAIAEVVEMAGRVRVVAATDIASHLRRLAMTANRQHRARHPNHALNAHGHNQHHGKAAMNRNGFRTNSI